MDCRPDLIYLYDGSFDGLLCCVFESYDKKEIPADVVSPDGREGSLFSRREVPTDGQKARRVAASIPRKMGREALEFIQHAFLTCFDKKELYILLFLRLGYVHGPSVMQMLANDIVHTLFTAVQHLEKESHLFKGFLRFSIFNNVLVGEIEPKNLVLPLLVRHFCERYPEERFLIHDKTHGMGLIYQPYESAVIPIGKLELPEADEEERSFRELWQLFYDTIEVQGRHNPQCRMSHMPKRYWRNMTEFCRTEAKPSVKVLDSGVDGRLLERGKSYSDFYK